MDLNKGKLNEESCCSKDTDLLDFREDFLDEFELENMPIEIRISSLIGECETRNIEALRQSDCISQFNTEQSDNHEMIDFSKAMLIEDQINMYRAYEKIQNMAIMQVGHEMTTILEENTIESNAQFSID